MSPELRSTIQELPSYFSTHYEADRYREFDYYLIGLGCNLEEFVLAEYEAGNVVVVDRISGRIAPERLNVIAKDGDNQLSVAEVIDFAEYGMYVWDTKAQRLKASFFGEEYATDKDLQVFFQTQVEANRELPIVGLEKDKGMGDFMEAYALGECHLDIDDTEDTERFIGDMKRVLADQEFYFGLEKFLRAKGIIRKSELVDPVIYFSESSGRIAVCPEDHNTHFNTYWEIVKINREAQNIIAEKPVEYQK